MGNYEFRQSDANVPINSALGRLFPHFSTAQRAPIHIRVDLPERANGASEEIVSNCRRRDTAILLLDHLPLGGGSVQLRPHAGFGAVCAQVVGLMPGGQGSAETVRFLEEGPKWVLRT